MSIAGLYGEFQFGAAKDAHNALGIFPGTGIGGAFIYEGKILQGNGRVVHGDWTYPGGAEWAFVWDADDVDVWRQSPVAWQSRQPLRKPPYRGQAPYVRELAGTDMSDIRSGLIADAVEKIKLSKQIVQDAAYQIGLAAGSMIHLLAPDKIVLGGGLAEHFPTCSKRVSITELKTGSCLRSRDPMKSKSPS